MVTLLQLGSSLIYLYMLYISVFDQFHQKLFDYINFITIYQ